LCVLGADGEERGVVERVRDVSRAARQPGVPRSTLRYKGALRRGDGFWRKFSVSRARENA
jgi:hypothetical protein